MDEIKTLSHGEWVSGNIMNFYLLLEWYENRSSSPCYFVDLFTIGDSRPADPSEIQRFRKLGLFISDSSRAPMKPVVLIICRNHHFFTLWFDYFKNEAWVLGRKITVRRPKLTYGSSWDEWKGHLYWEKIAQLFNWSWSIKTNPVQVNTYDFPQVNSLHCCAYKITKGCFP